MEIAILVGSLAISVLGTLLTAFFYLGSYKEKVNHLEKESESNKKCLQEVRDKVISCETSLKERGPLTKRESPVSLTERGAKFLTESGGKKFIDEYYIALRAKVEGRGPKTSYDIQEESRNVLKEESEDENFSPLKEYLFKEGLELSDLITVMGIYLRDRILKDKGIDLKDIDEHTPKEN